MERFWSQLAAIFAVFIITSASLASETATSAPTSTYSIRSGDLLHIYVWKEEELDRELLVLPDGTIDFPLIGSVSAQGNTVPQLQETIRDRLNPYVPNATVTVMVKETRGNVVSVMGQVTRPGDIIMNRSLNVMQALSQAGGLTPYADADDIVILRTVKGKQISMMFDYTSVARGKRLEKNITLRPGDVIVVPTASLF